MKSKVIAILEARTGEHLADLVARRGAIPLSVPALEEVPDLDPAALEALIDDWRVTPFDHVVFQTGVGTKALFQGAQDLGLLPELSRLLAASTVVVRGPKPVGELNLRGVRIDLRAATPFTTETVLEAMQSLPLHGTRVLVQRYGAANERLRLGLEARAAHVAEVVTYRWALPADTQPLQRLIERIQGGAVDAVVFTSAVQVQHLFEVARLAGRDHELADGMGRCIVASIGPVCSRALTQFGVRISLEATPPKLGPLISALETAWD